MKRKLLISLLHALLLTFLHLLYINSNWSLSLEDELIVKMNKIQTFADHERKKENVLFINTAHDNSLIEFESEDGDSGNLVIADRQLLSRFFRQLADHHNGHRFVLCDILFDYPSPSDSLFRHEVARVQKLIMPKQFDEENHAVLPSVIQSNSALAVYEKFEPRVSKMMLYARSIHEKTLPMKMYEACSGSAATVLPARFGLWGNNKYIPSSIYPRYYFDQESMKPFEMSLRKVVESLESENGGWFYDNFVKGRYVLIGNFSSDIHPTPIGFLPGSMVLFNTFLTLQSNYHQHSLLWFVYLFAGLTLLCYYEFYYKRQDRLNKTVYAVSRFLGLSGLVIAMSLGSYFLFHVHTTILPVILYFEAFHFVTRILKKKTA
jgi:hypothetical protein